MKLTKRTKGYLVETEEYKPSTAELHFYYSGTHAGINPTNPYRKRGSIISVKKTWFEPIKESKADNEH